MNAISPLRRTILVAVACAGCLSGTALTTARAGDEPALGGLFQRLFSPPAPQEAAPAQAPNTEAGDSYAQRRGERAEGGRPRIRYAALRRSEPLQLHVGDRQKPLDMKAGAAAAFLKDETLQPGDIVVLKDGARVFTGQPGRRHAPRDFESAQVSSLLDRRTRVLLEAMVKPASVGASAATRALAARLRDVPAPIVVPAVSRMDSAAVRVVYPANFLP